MIFQPSCVECTIEDREYDCFSNGECDEKDDNKVNAAPIGSGYGIPAFESRSPRAVLVWSVITDVILITNVCVIG